MQSHPTWVRGLKLADTFNYEKQSKVAPYVGAWIETHGYRTNYQMFKVAPYVGAWIETLGVSKHFGGMVVAPYVGAWIETFGSLPTKPTYPSRTLRGCVD